MQEESLYLKKCYKPEKYVIKCSYSPSFFLLHNWPYPVFIYRLSAFWNSPLPTISVLGAFLSLTVASPLTYPFALLSHLTVLAAPLGLAPSLVMVASMTPASQLMLKSCELQPVRGCLMF